LPHSFWCYRPIAGAPEVNPLPALTSGFVTFGCLNNPAKSTVKALDLWADVLQAVPSSHLLLATEGSLREELTTFFQSKQIDPSRLKFVGPVMPNEHLQRFHLFDISLDPLPYTGHTSTLDSLWMGVPVITLSGETSVARGSVTALMNVRLDRLIAETAQEYESIAAELASNTRRIAQLRQTLRSCMQNSALCNEKQFTLDLEVAFRELWQGWKE
jgi:protein O-GlcNAc transferase